MVEVCVCVCVCACVWGGGGACYFAVADLLYRFGAVILINGLLVKIIFTLSMFM